MDKKNLNFVLGEKLATCPFNPSHRVPVSRLPAHNVACKKNHPDMEMKTCPFCATHLIPKPLFQAHLLECPQKAIVERDLYQRKEMERLPGNPQPVVQAPQEHQQPYQFEDEEDWDSEMVESSYNPEAAMAYKEFTRPPPPGCLAKSKRKEWRAKEVERVEKLRNGEAYVLDEPDTVMAQNFAGKAKPSNDLMTSTHPLRRPSAASLALSSKMMGQLSISDDKRRLAQNPSSEKWNGAEKGGLEKPNFGFVVEENIVRGRGIKLLQKSGPGLSLGRGRGHLFNLLQRKNNPGLQS
ncbi:uncharacterized protein LOC143041806 isoform X2 [Oratosquilla oratoria]|uniref:uncharacterized protein LOC143041806 isoform X2 n=1 Tax=Oratosquilla oratoria TaxID=337810 RepID=UPI003F76756D